MFDRSGKDQNGSALYGSSVTIHFVATSASVAVPRTLVDRHLRRSKEKNVPILHPEKLEARTNIHDPIGIVKVVHGPSWMLSFKDMEKLMER